MAHGKRLRRFAMVLILICCATGVAACRDGGAGGDEGALCSGSGCPDVGGSTGDTGTADGGSAENAGPAASGVTIGGAPGATSSTTVSFTFSCDEADCSFECRLDAGEWSPCVSPHTVTGLTEGTHTFSVRRSAVDGVGAAGAESSWTFVVDRTPPTLTIDQQPAAVTTQSDALFRFRCDEASCTFSCRLDGGPWQACDGGQFVATQLISGRHTL